MAKIRRRMKNGKEVGNCGVRVGGKWVNLGTKDHRIANKRATLARAGRWPLPEVAEQAAEVAARAEHVPEEPKLDLPGPQKPTAPFLGDIGEYVPSPDPPAVPVVEPDPVAAARAAAGDIGGDLPATGAKPEPVDIAREMGRELQRELFPEGNRGGDDPGLVGASILFSLEHELGQKIASRAKPPRFVPEPGNDDLLVRVTACACRVLARNWTGDIAIHPLWILLGVALVGYPLQMALTARTDEQLKAASAAEAAKASGAS